MKRCAISIPSNIAEGIAGEIVVVF
ncbi:MAG: hypothetical protein ACOZBH_05655 [Patescibacteria group bacterium]